MIKQQLKLIFDFQPYQDVVGIFSLISMSISAVTYMRLFTFFSGSLAVVELLGILFENGTKAIWRSELGDITSQLFYEFENNLTSQVIKTQV